MEMKKQNEIEIKKIKELMENWTKTPGLWYEHKTEPNYGFEAKKILEKIKNGQDFDAILIDYNQLVSAYLKSDNQWKKCTFEGCDSNCNGYDSDHMYSNCLNCGLLKENCKSYFSDNDDSDNDNDISF